MNLGEQILPCQFNATDGLQKNFDDYRGKWLILPT